MRITEGRDGRAKVQIRLTGKGYFTLAILDEMIHLSAHLYADLLGLT